MTCKRTDKLLSAYADGALCDKDVLSLRLHASACAACAAKLAFYEGFAELKGCEQPIPEDFVLKVMQKVEQEPLRVPAPRRWAFKVEYAFAAAAVVVLTVGLGGGLFAKLAGMYDNPAGEQALYMAKGGTGEESATPSAAQGGEAVRSVQDNAPEPAQAYGAQAEADLAGGAADADETPALNEQAKAAAPVKKSSRSYERAAEPEQNAAPEAEEPVEDTVANGLASLIPPGVPDADAAFGGGSGGGTDKDSDSDGGTKDLSDAPADPVEQRLAEQCGGFDAVVRIKVGEGFVPGPLLSAVAPQAEQDQKTYYVVPTPALPDILAEISPGITSDAQGAGSSLIVLVKTDYTP